MNLDSSSGFDLTVEVETRPAAAKAKDDWAVQLVLGSAPDETAETNNLLRRRVRAAALMLFSGFAAFLLRGLFFLDRLDTSLDWIMFSNHVLVTTVTGLVGLRLYGKEGFIARHLRLFELVVFADAALFFCLLSYWLLTTTAARGYLIHITPFWMILLFVYALFIPNTLRRAIFVIGSMAATPILLCLVLLWTSTAYAKVIRDNPDFNDFVVTTAMVMILAAVAAIWGVHRIGSLRREAFEARRLGQYRLKEKLGEGGMGDVYLGEHLLLKRPCAIKLIKPDRAGDERALARFEREVKATAKLTHWNTIEIYDYGMAEDGTFYYAMEYLPGLNLSQLVQTYGPLPAGRVIHLLSQTCEALREAHHRDLIHRDIKPANIFAAQRGGVFDVAKLLDFGLAKPVTNLSETDVTVEGTITGSPLYMSPELVLGTASPDVRSDIYSLGVVAYYLISGAPPFQSDRPMEIMLAHARDTAPLPSTHNPDAPHDLEQVIARCMEKDPNDRYQDVETLRQALCACDAAGTWTQASAVDWWRDHGCPKKKALDKSIFDPVTTGVEAVPCSATA